MFGKALTVWYSFLSLVGVKEHEPFLLLLLLLLLLLIITFLQEDLPTLIAKEKEAYDDAIASTAVAAAAVAAAADGGPGNSTGAVDLNMRVLIKDGDELIADSSGEAGFLGACVTFEAYVTKRFPRA